MDTPVNRIWYFFIRWNTIQRKWALLVINDFFIAHYTYRLIYLTHGIHSWALYQSFQYLEPFQQHSWQRLHNDWNCSPIIQTQVVQWYNSRWRTIYCYTIPCCNCETTNGNVRITDQLCNTRWKLNAILSECVWPYLAINHFRRLWMRWTFLRQTKSTWVPSLQLWMLLLIFWFTPNEHDCRSHIEYFTPFTSRKYIQLTIVPYSVHCYIKVWYSAHKCAKHPLTWMIFTSNLKMQLQGIFI